MTDAPDHLPSGLSLRLGARRPVLAPDVAAFAGVSTPPRLHGGTGGPGVVGGIGVVGAPASIDRPSTRVLIVYFERAAYPIPARGTGLGVPPVAAFAIRATRFGYLAAVSSPRTPRARARWLVAACLPLALLPTVVQAAPASIAPPTTRKASKKEPTPPKLPPDDAGATPSDGEATDDEPTAEGPPSEDELVVDAAATRPPPPPAVVRMTCPEPGPTTAVDAAWQGVEGLDVDLTLDNGRELTGRVTALQRDTFTLIDVEAGGVVRVLRKDSVAQMRVSLSGPTGPLPSQDGTGLLVGGGLLTALGAPVFLTGAVFLGICPSCTYIHIPMLLVGGAALGGAIPMLVKGTRRRRAYMDARVMQIAPALSRTRHGWTGGLRLRF